MNEQDRKNLTTKAILKLFGKTEENLLIREGKFVAKQIKEHKCHATE
ncbi:unnamed protein product [marine sediment metagenome]|uniref:Uncharacterized protein n=1 Tax=marine sediment metagenome TaxID=412755 RepID=X1UY43_9ZZZZ